MKEFILSWGMLVVSVLFNALGAFIIKLKLNQFGAIELNSWSNIWQYALQLLKSPAVVGGGVLFFASPFLFMVALSRMDITLAYPVQVGLNFVFIMLLATIFLGEQLTLLKLLGIVFVAIGIFFINR